MDKIPNITKLPALIEEKRLLEAEYLTLDTINSEQAFEIVGELGKLQERIDFHSQTGVYAPKETVQLTGTYCNIK